MLLKRINIALSTTVLAVCATGFALFGWSGSGWKALAVPTGSMRPAIQPGSLVLVHSVPISSLKVGDVITHMNPLRPNTTISHRIIRIYELDGKVPMFVTKGDANKSADVPIPSGEVVGKVMWHVPYAGWALIDAKKPVVILPIIYIAGLLIVIEEVQRITGYYKRFAIYRLAGFERETRQVRTSTLVNRFGIVAVTTTVLMLIGAAMAPVALAAIHSKTVGITDNTLSVAESTKGACSGTSPSTVTINNTASQNAHSGSVSGGGGSAASGSASNGNSTSTSITVVGC